MGKVGIEPTVFTAWVADLQSAAIAAMLTCPNMEAACLRSKLRSFAKRNMGHCPPAIGIRGETRTPKTLVLSQVCIPNSITRTSIRVNNNLGDFQLALFVI